MSQHTRSNKTKQIPEKPDKLQQRKTRPIRKEKELYLVYVETYTGQDYTKEERTLHIPYKGHKGF